MLLNPKLPALQSLVYVSNQKEYVAHFQRYKYDPAKVASIMQARGCTKGSDGMYRDANAQQLRIESRTNAGDDVKEKIVQGVLAEAGNQSIDELAGERDGLLLGLLALRGAAK